MLLVRSFDVESGINSPVFHADYMKEFVTLVKCMFNSPGCGYAA